MTVTKVTAPYAAAGRSVPSKGATGGTEPRPPSRPAPRGAPAPPRERRGRLEEMPRVPGPQVALDAAAPPPLRPAQPPQPPRRPAPPPAQPPEAQTSWARPLGPADLDDEDDDSDVSLRTLFRRRR